MPARPMLAKTAAGLSDLSGGRFALGVGAGVFWDEIVKRSARSTGSPRERIRQIESKTMSKLRHPSRSQVLRDYLAGAAT